MPKVYYTILYKKSVVKDLKKIPQQERIQITKKIQRLAESPYPPSAVKLQGSAQLFRIRHGDYRIVYEVRDRQLIIVVIKVGHRREVYRDV